VRRAPRIDSAQRHQPLGSRRISLSASPTAPLSREEDRRCLL
jgi:hypothetical protein